VFYTKYIISTFKPQLYLAPDLTTSTIQAFFFIDTTEMPDVSPNCHG